ncbi:MAG: hypothetical protein AAFQ53_00210 [Bacteroidota bacterium]
MALFVFHLVLDRALTVDDAERVADALGEGIVPSRTPSGEPSLLCTIEGEEAESTHTDTRDRVSSLGFVVLRSEAAA